MSDLIDRELLIEQIKEDSYGNEGSYGDMWRFMDTINKMPSAQPEIIRCKDCKNYYFADNRVPSEQSWVCDAWGIDQTAHMGYCFKAERKEE